MSEATGPACLPRRPALFGTRLILVAAIAVATLWSIYVLDLGWGDLLPGRDDLGQVVRFSAAALRPALHHLDPVPEGTRPLLLIAADSVRLTVVFAACAMSLALVAGAVLGILGSTVWWSRDPVGTSSSSGRWLRQTAAPAIYGFTRALIALMRSVHELIWALLLLAAVGLSDLSAIIAIAIPYAGTLAKVFSESLDEAPRDTANALRGAGATQTQVAVFGLLPRALPDMSAYALYRFECAVRSSAILGFFGWQTLGYHIRLEWGMADYREVWTFLYALLALVVLLDWWSGALRKRFVA